jgi:hypothetical protein
VPGVSLILKRYQNNWKNSLMNKNIFCLIVLPALAVFLSMSLNAFAEETFTPYQADEVPQNATDLWKDYNPHSEDLDVKVIKEWKEGGVVTRYITFKIGTFKGADSRIAANPSLCMVSRRRPASGEVTRDLFCQTGVCYSRYQLARQTHGEGYR